MAKFSTIAKGRRARKTVFLECGLEEPVRVDVRVLLPDEEADVLARARAFVVSKGMTDAQEGHSAFELGRMVNTLHLACIDTDSPEDRPEPFFASANEILTSEILHRDNVAALYEQQQMWQDEVAKQPLEMSADDFEALMGACAGDDPLPFVLLRPGKRWVFVRFMATLLSASLRHKSESSSPSESSTNDESESEKPQPETE